MGAWDTVVALSAGTVLGHGFEIERRAGSGGMGTVFRALDRQTALPVAVKLIQAQAGRAETERFAREAQILAQLRHPSIVSYVAHGHTPAGQPFLAMEWLEGEDLGIRLARGPLGVAECVLLVRGVAEALGAAHRRGIVHRDLKPSNLFLRGGAIAGVTLLDFGIARPVHVGSGTSPALRVTALTRTGSVIGTPEYMAPEQARGQRDVRPSADVFSLGCVLFECLTGRPPFAGDHLAAVLAKILFEPAPPVDGLRPGVPAALATLLDRMLAKAPELRPADADALLAELPPLAEVCGHEEAPGAPRYVRVRDTLADDEQRPVSVVVARAPAAITGGPLGLPATLDEAEVERADTRRQALSGILCRHGARAEWLVDGSVVATLVEARSVTDQAAQAARCALALHELWPEASVALATGRGVVTSSIPLGEAIDRAVDLLDDDPAATGERVVLDEVSAGLLDTRFTLERARCGFVLLGERAFPDETKPLLGRPTPCVGRDQELTTLEAVLSTCVEESVARAVLVSAPPGMGKSRLRHEFLRRLRARSRDEGAPVQILVGRGDLMSAGSPYDLLGRALRGLIGAQDGEPFQAQQAKLSRRLGESVAPGDVTRVAEFLGELAGMPFPDGASERLRAARHDPRLMSDQVGLAFTDFLRAECARHPVLLVLEDLHWGDVLTVTLIERALSELADRPWMVLAFARPEVSELFPRLWAERLTEIRLGGLSRKASERLVLEVLGRETPAETVARVVEQAAGNALYLEELIRASREGNGEGPPETVVAMVQARLLRLPPGARRALRAGSVFGGTFWRGGVLALAGQDRGADEVDPWFDELVGGEVVERRRESRFPGETEYVFRHSLVREAAYTMLTEEDRARGHRMAGVYLEQVGERDPIVVAGHHERGGERERAVPFYIQAADQAMTGNDLAGALGRAERGIACGARDEALGILRSIEAGARFWRDEWAQGYPAGTEALARLRPGGLRWCRTMAHMFIFTSMGLQKHEHFAELVAQFGGAEPDAEARTAYVEAAAWLVTMFSILGARDASRGFLARLDAIGATMGQGDGIAEAWSAQAHMFHVRMLGADPWATLVLAQRSRDAFLRTGDRRNLAFVDAYRGIALGDLGRLAEAEDALRESLALAERLHEGLVITNARLYLCVLLARQPERAREVQELAAALSDDNPLAVGVRRGARAQALAQQGDLEAAAAEAEGACAMLGMMPALRIHPLAVWIRVLLRQGRAGEARALAEDGAGVLGRLGEAGYNEVALRTAAAEALEASGDVEGARAAREAARAQTRLRAETIPDPAARGPYQERGADTALSKR